MTTTEGLPAAHRKAYRTRTGPSAVPGTRAGFQWHRCKGEPDFEKFGTQKDIWHLQRNMRGNRKAKPWVSAGPTIEMRRTTCVLP